MQHLKPLHLHRDDRERTSYDGIESQRTGELSGSRYNGAVSDAWTRRVQDHQQSRQAITSTATTRGVCLPKGHLLFPQIPQADPAGALAFDCFHVMLKHQQPFYPEAAVHENRQRQSDTLTRSAVRAHSQTAIPGPRTFVSSGLSQFTSCEVPGGGEAKRVSRVSVDLFDRYSPAVKVPCVGSSAQASASQPAVPTASAPSHTSRTATCTLTPAVVAPTTAAVALERAKQATFGVSLRCRSTKVKAATAESTGVPPPEVASPLPGCPHSERYQVLHYWSPPVSASSTAVVPCRGRTAALNGDSASSCRYVAKMPTPRAIGSSGAEASSPAASTDRITAKAAFKATGMRHRVLTKESVITRRQAAAAALAEVVRIDDSSDDDAAVDPVADGRERDFTQKTPTKEQGPPIEESTSGERPTAYVIFMAAVVEGDGRCCLLNVERVLTAAKESRDFQHQQQQCSSNGDTGATTAVPAAEASTNGEDAYSRLLVLQVSADENVISLDVWKHLVASSPQHTSASGVSEEPKGTLRSPVAGEDILYTLFSFPKKSIRQMRCLELCTERSRSSRSKRRSSKEICRRCGRRRTRTEGSDRSRKAERIDSKYTECSALFEKADKDHVKLSLERRCSSSCVQLHTTVEGKIGEPAFSGLTALADAVAHGPTVNVPGPRAATKAQEHPIDRGQAAYEALKGLNESSEVRRSHTRNQSIHSGSRSASSREAARDPHRGHRSRRRHRSETEKHSSHRNSKRTNGGVPECHSSREKRSRKHSSCQTGISSSGPPKAISGLVPALCTLTPETKQHLEVVSAPHKALTATKGGPGFGGLLGVLRSRESKIATGAADSSQCRADCSKTGISGGSSFPKELSTRHCASDCHQDSTCDVGALATKEPQQPTIGDKATLINTSASCGDKLCEGCPCDRAEGGSTPSERKQRDSPGPAVPVLCLELKQSKAEELQCSNLLQNLLRSYQGPTCEAKSRSEGEQKPKVNPQEATPDTSSATGETQVHSSNSTASRHISCSTSHNRIGSCSSDKNNSRHGRRSSENGEENTGAARLPSSRSSSNHSGTPKRHASGKRHHRSIPSTQEKSHHRSTSSRRKRRRDASLPSTAAADGLGVASSKGHVSASRPQRETGAHSSSNYFVEQLQSSGDVLAEAEQLRDTRNTPPELQEKDNGENVSAVRSPFIEKRMDSKDQTGGFCLSGKKKSLWLVFCIGPSLHVAADTGPTTPKDGRQDSLPSLFCLDKHLPPTYSATAHGSSTRMTRELRKRSNAVFNCRGPDLLPLCSAFIPAASSGATTACSGAVPEGPEKCITVKALAKALTGRTAEHRSYTGGSRKENNRQVTRSRQLTAVLESLVSEGYNCWESLNRSNGLICNLSLELLLQSWRTRVIRSPKFPSGSVDIPQKPVQSLSAEPATKISFSKEGSGPSATPAAPASPVFDLLLDDKTLRRLSGKEFLDDTIIDFCLGFIVDHILTPEERLRVHISNTFFLPALMGQICEVEGHSRLTRWLKKELTPLPKKDFIFIPVHHKNQHWSLAVVVYPWRAVHCTSENGVVASKRIPDASVFKQDIDLQRVDDALLKSPVTAPSCLINVGRTPCHTAASESTTSSATKWLMGKSQGLAAFGRSGAPHACSRFRPKARMFHVDSMGLRSVFDRCRGRLKRFLRREFEYRCGGLVKSGESAEFCTESCCWQDGLSCTLHTPRQQNGYDCGVFVVEYVFFLIRNLNAIEAILSGPSREHQPHELLSTHCLGTGFPLGHPGSTEGSTGLSTCAGELEAILGFSCPCMSVKNLEKAPLGPESISALSLSVKVRLAELRRARAATLTSAAIEHRQQRQGQKLTVCHSTLGNPSKDTVESLESTKPLHEELAPLPSFGTLSAPASDGRLMADKFSRHANVLLTPVHVSEAKKPLGRSCHDTPDAPSTEAGLIDFQASCPFWGPLPDSFCKRRSAHTKWFSQDRVTQRRSQLYKMLVFMRENTNWREDPKLIAHLKSLFLDVGGS